MYINHENNLANYEKVFKDCCEYVNDMLRMHIYRGIIRMDNRNGSSCIAEACVRRLCNQYCNKPFSKVDIDYMADSDGCYIIVTTKW